jgi:hypothetical protein
MKKPYFIKSQIIIIDVLLLGFFLLPDLFSQNIDTTQYFQLHLGDRYDYYKISYPLDCPFDGKDSIKLGNYEYSTMVKDTISISGKKYFILTHFIWNWTEDTIRIDSAGNMRFLYQGRDTMLIKFNAMENEWWRVGDFFFAMKSRKDTLKLKLKTFFNCLWVTFGAAHWPEYYFYDGFGKVCECNDYGNYALGKARINGIEYQITTSVINMKPGNGRAEYGTISNYPNPFNPSTIINYKIPADGFVTLKVYDLLGKEVRTLINENKTSGAYSIPFKSENLSSGTYYYQLKIKPSDGSKEIMLQKSMQIIR